MMVWRAAGIGISLLVLIGNVLCEEPSVCPVRSAARSIVGVGGKWCDLDGGEFVGVIEGDEASLISAVQINNHDYVALLFYASWCPFSIRCRPAYSIISALYPTIPHFAIEESSIRPSILSKYRVHGFPTLFLINSTMPVRYRGTRSLRSLVAFYSDVTSMKPATLNITAVLANHKPDDGEYENCGLSRTTSPVNLVQQETYLALAITFVIMRLAYLSFPSMNSGARCLWAKYAGSMRLTSLLEHRRTCLNGACHLIKFLKDPFRKQNLKGLNAKAWASKSLASVSIGDTSGARRASVSDH